MPIDQLRRTLPTPNDRQEDVIYLDADRDQVVLGTAGSGKTLMAVHRAVYLADQQYNHAGRTLLVTYNKALVSYLRHLAGGASAGVDIRNYHHVARGYLRGRGQFGGYNIVLDGHARNGLARLAIEHVASTRGPTRLLSRPLEFFLDELDWISGHGFSERDAYYAAERRGRLAPLQPSQRQVLWEVRDKYLSLRAENGYRYDWWELPSAVLAELNRDQDERLYRHIVIDEAQDLPPEAIRSLVQMVDPDGSVTLFADYAQQLYGQRTSYVSCGLRVRKAEEFKENFRNSVGIANLAIGTSALPHFTDSLDLVVPTSPTTAGTPPTLFRAANAEAERDAVRAQAQQLGATGRVAILAPTWSEARWYTIGLNGVRGLKEDSPWSDKPGIYFGTYYSAKGLEFDGIIMPGLNASDHPDPDAAEAFGHEEAMERDARLLYVGITRARDELLATYTEEFTSVLPSPESGLWLTSETPG
ncbi:3'-5' exonuclease [Leifsonia sp. RAF41]|uniref:3'-5' exonuclease n=1 Tax=Leifsonia sp. RAF41 TaxID=3233056 RepID=UPI003F9DB547